MLNITGEYYGSGIGAVDGTLPSNTVVNGPSSSTDNAIARYDGTTGNIQDSLVTIADTTGKLRLTGTDYVSGKAGYTLQLDGSGNVEANNVSASSASSTGDITNIKFQHGAAGIVTLGTGYATKLGDVVTIYIPSFLINTEATTNDIVSQLIDTSALIPEGTTNKMGQLMKVGTAVCICSLEITGSSWYITINKVDGSVWTVTTNTVDAFSFSYRCANSTALSSTQQFATGSPYTPPSVSSYSPADNATGIAIGVHMVLTFNENISQGSSGNVYLYKTSGDTLVTTIAYNDAQLTFGTTTLTINPTADLENSIEYYIKVDGAVVEDTVGNQFAGITDTTTWSFTTIGLGIDYLDGISNITAGLSTHRLLSAYSGNAIRIRASGDNAETDIGFDGNGLLDTTAINSHLTTHGGTAFVVTWYDQVGSNNFTQATTGNQPALTQTSSIWNIVYDGTNDNLAHVNTTNSMNSSNLNIETTFTAYANFKTTTAAIQYITASTNYHKLHQNSSQMQYLHGPNVVVTENPTDGNLHWSEAWDDNSTTLSLTVDGTSNTGTRSASVTSETLYIGNNGAGAAHWNGSVNTLIFASAKLASGDMSTIKASIAVDL